MTTGTDLPRTAAEALRAKVQERLLSFAVRSRGDMASAIIRASREDLSNLTAGMAVSALCDEGIKTDAEFEATSSYFEAGFDVALDLVALTLAGRTDDDGNIAIQAVLDDSYARITDIIAKYYVELAAQRNPRLDAAESLRKRSSRARSEVTSDE